MNVKLAVVGFILTTGIASLAQAHSAAFRLGLFAPRIESELWDENVATFAIERSDFDSVMGGAEVSVELSDVVDVTFGAETSSRTVFSIYR